MHASLPSIGRVLTHLSLASFLWDIHERCETRSDDTEWGVRSSSLLFACRMNF